MTDAYFQETSHGFAPEFRAHGPWADDMLHGRLLGGLATRQIEADYVATGWRVSRLTVDLFRPAAMAPVQITTQVVRDGRKVKVVDASITCAGHEVGRVTALVLVEGEEPPGSIWRPDEASWPDPTTLPPPDDGTGAAEDDGWLFRIAQGGFGSGEQSRVWTNETVRLVDDEVVSPLVRAAVSGDIACPLANSSDQGLHYINADYTLLLARYPVGDWVGIEVVQQLQSNGISIASATLVDQAGAFGTSSGSSLVRPPMFTEPTS